jgi:hypothetical protein
MFYDLNLSSNTQLKRSAAQRNINGLYDQSNKEIGSKNLISNLLTDMFNFSLIQHHYPKTKSIFLPGGSYFQCF